MSDDAIEAIRAQLVSGCQWYDAEEVRTLFGAIDARDRELAEARAERDRALEHAAALQRCLGAYPPDEPETWATAVGRAMREAIESSERDRDVWRERWETLAAALSAEVGPWEGCGVAVAVQRARDEARREAIVEATRLYHRTRARCYDDEEHDATYLGALRAILDGPVGEPPER